MSRLSAQAGMHFKNKRILWSDDSQVRNPPWAEGISMKLWLETFSGYIGGWMNDFALSGYF